MPLDIESAKHFIVGHIFEKGDFVPRQDLMIDSQSREPEYSRKQLKIHSPVSGQAINQLVEEKVLVELLSSDLLEEIIRTGMPEDDSFTDRNYIQLADQFTGDSIICLGPRLNFFVMEHFSELVEMASENGFDAFQEFCNEILVSNVAGVEESDRVVSRSSLGSEIEKIDRALEELERRLRQDNDLSSELADRRDVILSELNSLRHLIGQPEFRPSVVLNVGKRTFHWIADKAGGAAVGAAALALLAMISGLLG